VECCILNVYSLRKFYGRHHDFVIHYGSHFYNYV